MEGYPKSIETSETGGSTHGFRKSNQYYQTK
jgi:hypothetical protein